MRSVWHAAGRATLLGAVGLWLTVAAGPSTVPAQAAVLGDTSTPIVLAVNEWSGQHITTYLAGAALTRMGYKVEYVRAGYIEQWPQLASGDLTASLEIWSNNVGEHWEIAEKSGEVVSLGPLGLETREGLAYNAALAKSCRGLPDWRALKNEDCVAVIARQETADLGVLLDYPDSWDMDSATMIAALELPLVSRPMESERTLMDAVRDAAKEDRPALARLWSPHWVFATTKDLKWVSLPKHEPACLTDPAWGPNPKAVGDCAPPNATTFKVAWSGAAEKWPAAVELMKAMRVDAAIQEPLMAAIELRAQPVTQVVDRWMSENEAVWKPWIEAALGAS